MTGAALLHAAKTGELATLRELLAQDGAHLLGFRGEGTPDAVIGNTAVHWAAAKGQAAALRLLLEAQGDPHARNQGDSTPLHTAAMNGHAECAKLLLDAGADPRQCDEFGDSPLSLAAAKGHAAVAALLQAAAEAPAGWEECKAKGNTAFHAGQHDAALAWYTQAVSLAPQAEAAPLHSNRSACLAAAGDFDGALEAARLAVELRPEWAKAHARVGAALHGKGEWAAAEEAYAQAVRLEPTNGAAAAALKEVRLAARNARLEALIERGAFQKQESAEASCGGGEAKGKKEKSAEQLEYARVVGEWMAAAKAGDVAALERLLAQHAWLLTNRSEETAESLLGNTATHWAAAHGRVEAVRWLLSREGVQRDGTNQAGGTPLHSAAAHARASVVSVLLEAGADPSAKDDSGETPRDAATRRGYRSVEAVFDRGPTSNLEARWGATGSTRPESIESAKQAGNEAFSSTDPAVLRRAIWHYTDALLLRPPEEMQVVLLSNRSAAHAKCAQYHAALEDAEQVVALKPDWGKGHGRRAAALQGLQDWKQAEAAYRLGLQCDPSNAQLKQGLQEVLERTSGA
ncbi:hypothetical protein AB1Y20_009828 [Prymnesium parvum]|uniref:Uncharacterized protein n=1 Tax=Prymnesium parvum TaxID=97485 RepID=A0AB34K370_PRYPA